VLTLGDFYPAYFDVTLTGTPTLADTCSDTFSYLGQSIDFETAPGLTLTAYNAIGAKTLNYSDVYWNYLPDETILETYFSFLDSSSYAKDNSATVINLGDEPVIANNDNYDGSGTVTIINSNLRYNKVNPDDNCTSIALTQSNNQFVLTAINEDITNFGGNVESQGLLLMGLPDGEQFRLDAPCEGGVCTQGQLQLSLNPSGIGVDWPNHLNFDWNGDGFINITDFPKATVTFGQFRGNDRIIHWREVFN
jgi:hypothetical protein